MRKTISLFLCLCLFMSLWGAVSADAAWGRSDKAFSDNPQAIQDASESVVMLNCYDASGELYCTGSAFAAFAPGVFVTNYHVIEDGIYTIRAQLETGMEFRLTDVVGFDADNDIAILYTDVRTGIKELPIGNTSEMLKGEKVTAIGSPLGLVNTVSVGLYSGIIRDGGSTLLQFSAPISHGSSGGVEELLNRSELSSIMSLEEFTVSNFTEVDAIKAAGILTVAISPNFLSMVYVDPTKSGQDQYIGSDVSLAKYIADYLGVKAEFVDMMTDEKCLDAVENDEVDLSIGGWGWNEERADRFELSDGYVTGDISDCVIILHKGETALLTVVNEVLSIASENGLLDQWDKEAKAEIAKLARERIYSSGDKF